MELAALFRTMGALGVVVGLLAAALWAVRHFDLRLPGHGKAGACRRLELVETLAIDPRRSLALIRRDGNEHLILLAPEGHLTIESGIRTGNIAAMAALAADAT